MDMNFENNLIQLCGVMGAAPVYSHAARGERFYTFPLVVERLSGNSDTLNIVLRREQLEAVEVSEGEKLSVRGQLRSFNNRRGEGAKLVITVLAEEIVLCDEPDENHVWLTGTLCKAPNVRVTPLGRDICDLMLAVNRHYGRSDYLPCICWGLQARQAAQWSVGTRLHLEGRFQSRRYIKMSEDGPIDRVAFEVSVTEVAALSEAESLA
ncbi:MAG: single-stranded DNA-binding protein [Oscillospiraceae bacterium]|nr:single-stranded DNA-binding protein [Oscillospiraceae bacterium]